MSYELHNGPYTDFHDLNLEWVISEMRKAVNAWKESETYWTTAQNSFNDMKEAFDTNTAGYLQQWPAFQDQVNKQIADNKTEIEGEFNDYKNTVNASLADMVDSQNKTYSSIMVYIKTENENIESKVTQIETTLSEKIESVEKDTNENINEMQSYVQEYVENWFNNLNVAESVKNEVTAFLESETGKNLILESLNELIESTNEAISTLQEKTQTLETSAENTENFINTNSPKINDMYTVYTGYKTKKLYFNTGGQGRTYTTTSYPIYGIETIQNSITPTSGNVFYIPVPNSIVDVNLFPLQYNPKFLAAVEIVDLMRIIPKSEVKTLAPVIKSPYLGTTINLSTEVIQSRIYFGFGGNMTTPSTKPTQSNATINLCQYSVFQDKYGIYGYKFILSASATLTSTTQSVSDFVLQINGQPKLLNYLDCNTPIRAYNRSQNYLIFQMTATTTPSISLEFNMGNPIYG